MSSYNFLFAITTLSPRQSWLTRSYIKQSRNVWHSCSNLRGRIQKSKFFVSSLSNSLKEAESSDTQEAPILFDHVYIFFFFFISTCNQSGYRQRFKWKIMATNVQRLDQYQYERFSTLENHNDFPHTDLCFLSTCPMRTRLLHATLTHTILGVEQNSTFSKEKPSIQIDVSRNTAWSSRCFLLRSFAMKKDSNWLGSLFN